MRRRAGRMTGDTLHPSPRYYLSVGSSSKDGHLEAAYSSWPLGEIDPRLRRPELETLSNLGYKLDDPRDAVSLFEQEVAIYSGAKYAVATDSCTNGIALALAYRRACGESVSVPARTYVSIPSQILHAGADLVAREEQWCGLYAIEPLDIVDSAARFTPGMFVGGSILQVLSFQTKKRVPIGRGGMILTDCSSAYQWLKLASYDGRDLQTSYTDISHVKMLGWHMYMTPEDAARGLLLLNQLEGEQPDMMNSSHYPDWTQWPPFEGKFTRQ